MIVSNARMAEEPDVSDWAQRRELAAVLRQMGGRSVSRDIVEFPRRSLELLQAEIDAGRVSDRIAQLVREMEANEVPTDRRWFRIEDTPGAKNAGDV